MITHQHWLFYYFILSSIGGLILIRWALGKMEPLRIITEEDKLMAKKHPEFARNDLDKIKKNTWKMYLMAPVLFTRLVCGYMMISIIWAVVLVIMIGHPRDEVIPMWRRRVIKFIHTTLGRPILFSLSIVYIDDHDRYFYDYSKYLGPEWKPTYENTSTKVSNH